MHVRLHNLAFEFNELIETSEKNTFQLNLNAQLINDFWCVKQKKQNNNKKNETQRNRKEKNG